MNSHIDSQLTLPNLSGYSAQKCTSKVTSPAMISRRICPCCCSTLLRHARSGEIYWRCSTCYQEMPV